MSKPGTNAQKKELGRLRKKFGVKRTKKVPTGNAKIRNAKVSIFDGIEFKSGLELFCYKELKKSGIPFLYEQKKIEIHPRFTCGFPSIEQVGVYKTYKGAREIINPITYTPDFTDNNESMPKEFIIECKGWCNDIFPIKLKMFKKLLTDNGFEGTYYMPRNQKQVIETISLILKRRSDGQGQQAKISFEPLPSM